jgi:galactokinase/mevalonate kinase-like predicted kinase
LTRLAKNILYEIVRGIFLNSPSHLATLEEIGANAEAAFNAMQRLDQAALTDAIRTSWQLNQQLDSGTNPPAMQHLLKPIEDYVAATKLLGAGGGGFLLIFAKDKTAAGRIRDILVSNPPNARARFVDYTLSSSGLQLTRS